MKRSALSRAVGLQLVLAGLVITMVGCGPHDRPTERASTSRAALVTHNGFTENGLSTNGFTENGFTENGFTENGFTENGFTENGFTENGFTENGFTENGMSSLEIMQNDPNAIEFAQYAYSCALPPGKHAEMTINGTVVSFDGSLGLAPEWENGPCNDSCKRWISACLLARVNKYGLHVQLSLRAPRAKFLADGDTDSYDRTQYLELAVDPDPTLDESTRFPLREGAYFGNVFDVQPAGDGTLVQAPKYYACSGPGSSIPQLTNRFCSGQGDDCIIFTGSSATWSDCLNGPHACGGLDTATGLNGVPSNAVRGCTSPDGLTAYKEVLTVYLAHPTTLCGNGICEGEVLGAIYGDGAVPEDSTTCPQDCHPGTWATSVDLLQPNPCIGEGCMYTAQNGDNTFNAGHRFAVGPDNAVVRVLDSMPGSGAGINFKTEDGPLPAPGNASLLATYSGLGGPSLAKTISFNSDGTHTRSVTTDHDGNIILVTYDPLQVSKFDAGGVLLWTSTSFPAGNNIPAAGPVATDAAGNVFVAWSVTVENPDGTFTFPSVSQFLPDGTTGWVANLDFNNRNVFVESGSMATDAAGNVYLTDAGNLYKILPNGSQSWTKGVQDVGEVAFMGLTSDGDGNVYVAGRVTRTANIDFDPDTADVGPGTFVIKFTQPDGLYAWNYYVPDFVSSPILVEQLVAALVSVDAVRVGPPTTPVDVHIDSEGNVLLTGGFLGNGVIPNFGPGAFDSEGSPDTFLVALSASTGEYIWAKSFPLYSGGGTAGLAPGSDRQVFVTGGFDASMLLDSSQLLNTHPELVNNQNLFIGAFKAPCGTPGCDAFEPVWDLGTVPGAPLPPGSKTRVGNPIIVYATSQAGATVHYTLPLAPNDTNDPNYDGANIVCNPRTGSTFPIGVTTVTCTANDPHGNTATTSFPITVLGTAGPILLNLPKPMTLDATSPLGIVVNYQPPTATDQIDGSVPVTCTPASGSTFPVGQTTVDCTASDLASPTPNTTHGKFKVNVRFLGPPVITVPTGGVQAEATTATGATVTYSASAKDGLGNPIPVSCVPPSGSFFPLGVTTVTCTATDGYNNTASKSFTVTVTFHWFGFLSPISNTGNSEFHQGSAVPVKFKLRSGITNAVANLFVAKVTNGVPGPEQPAVASGTSNTGNLFRFDTCDKIYIFNMSTTNMAKGTWRLRVDLHDGEIHTVIIKLK
jgi:hypothetical protein